MLHQIGVGALGPVYRTYEPTRDRLVAVKVFRLDLTPEQSSALADELTRATEAGLLHPSIVEPVAAGLEGTVAYRAEEYVAAESLDVAMRHYAPASLDKALPFITQIAGAIDAARAAGVGHGALHPRDIFVTPDEARATGFGVVDALDRLGIRAPIRRPYSAPERIAGQPWSTPADVFSLGAIAFELLTGRRPSGLGDQMGSLAVPSLGSQADAIQPVLARAMHEDPSERFESASAFASALQEASGVEAAAPPAPVEPEPQPVDTTASALDDFAAEPISTGDSPREVARRVIAARKRRPKPLIEKPEEPPAAPPVALFADERPSEAPPTPPEAIPEATPEPVQAEAIAPTFAAQETPVPHDAIVPETIAEETAVPDSIVPETISPVERSIEMALRDVPSPEPAVMELVPDSLPIVAASTPSEDAPGAADAAAPLERDGHDRDVIRAVDEFRPRDVARDGTAPRAERSWPRAQDRVAAQLERSIVPPIKSPVDPIDADIPYVPIDDPTPDRPRPVMLPLAMALILGLVLGYLAGYMIGSREQAQDANLAQNTVPTQGAQSTPGTSGQTPPPASFSEGTVTPTTGRPAAPPALSDPASTTTSPKPAAAAPKPAAPARSSGTLVVTSTPSKAAVTVNGTWAGRTPLTLERPFGKYAVRIVQDGYDVASETVTLSSSSSSRTIDATLRPRAAPRAPDAPKPTPKPADNARAAARGATAPAQTKSEAKGTGEVFFDSRPQGARIFIDGKPHGITPLRLTGLSAGPHDVRLELADHQTWTTSTRVVPGTAVRVTGSLDRIR